MNIKNIYAKPETKTKKIISLFTRIGFFNFIKRIFDYIIEGFVPFMRIKFPLFNKIIKKPTFIFNNKKYTYFYHFYNSAWRYERTIEIPLALEFINNNKNKRILEVGNVLSHYFKVNWDILDKFERAAGVINEDIATFKPKQKYDVIVTISTLEHVGFHDDKIDPQKIIKAIDNIKKNILKKGGKMFVTFPLAYNPFLDKLLFSDKIQFNERYYMKKISRFNRWVQIDEAEAKRIKLNHPYRHVNGLFIGIIYNV